MSVTTVRASSWGSLFNCGYAWEYTHILGHRSPSSPRAQLGTAIHASTAAFDAARVNGSDPLMVMQNLYVIEGRPSWSSQFIIASINSCGRFSPLRFDISEPGKTEDISYSATFWKDGKKVTEQRKAKIKHQTCRAWVIEKETGDRLDGPLVSIQMAIDEGWLTKNGSKWLTMPEIMLRYRAASLLGRLYAPELLMGLQSREEVEDFIEATPDGAGNYAVDVNDLRNREPEPPSVIDDESETIDPKAGEVVRDTRETETKPAETATDQAEPATADADLPDDLAFE